MVMQPAIDALLAWKGGIITLWFALFFLAERLRPMAARHLAEAAWRRLSRNAGLWAANALLSLLVVVPISAWAASHALPWRPLWWRGSWGLALDLVLLDALLYWWHRANHEWPPLWRFHRVHHLDRFLDASTAVRFHAGEVLLAAAARAAVILALAPPVASVLVFETLVLLAAIFHHSNLRLQPALELALARVVVTPSIHWVHHHRRRVDTDANYGTVLSLWDRLFRSVAPGRRTPDMAIGVEGAEERPFLALIAAPFRAG
jgi:sterol desaturase/sphingolipid hydroxylase (fatty acid hydroxylase superfamily)